MKKKLVFTKHALERMPKRGVSKEVVMQIIETPNHELPIQADNTQEFEKKIDKKEYYVVVEHKKSVLVVKTTGCN